jgi:hypothetical protein
MGRRQAARHNRHRILTMLDQSPCMMKIRSEFYADSSPAADPSLLANFIEAMNRIDRRPEQRHPVIVAPTSDRRAALPSWLETGGPAQARGDVSPRRAVDKAACRAETDSGRGP